MLKGHPRLDREAPQRQAGLKGFLYWWLENEQNPHKAYFDLSLVTVIAFSVTVVVAQVTIEPRTSAFLRIADFMCLAIFSIEYLGRFYVSTDFVADINEGGFWHAVANKIRWMVKPMSIIDAVALIPAARALRTMRLFRLLRLARLLRVLKLARYTAGLSGYIEEFKKRAQEFLIAGAVTIGIIIFAGVTVFCVEKPAGNENINDILDAFWWSVVTLTTVGYGDAYPVTNIGRVVATILMLTSIGTVGALGAIITSVILSRVDDIKLGRAANRDLKEHILFCGWTPCADKVAKTLERHGILDEHQLVILSKSPAETAVGIYQHGDPASPDTLDKGRVESASCAVVFHDCSDHGDMKARKTADRQAILTALHIAAVNQKIPIIMELYDDAYLDGLAVAPRQQGGEDMSLLASRFEVVPKEAYDAEVIFTTLRTAGHTSEMLRDLADFEGNRIVTLDASAILGDNEDEKTSVQAVKQALLEWKPSTTLLGYADPATGDPVLNPENDTPLNMHSDLYVLQATGLEVTYNEEAAGAESLSGPRPLLPELPLGGTVLFLGWNVCANRVVDKLFAHNLLGAGQKITVISNRYRPSDTRVEHISADYSYLDAVEQVDWSEVSLAIVFFEVGPGESTNDVDKRNILAAMSVERILRRDGARVIVEIHNEKHVRLLRWQSREKVEVIFKERMDADLIANTIINPGRTTNLIREIASFEKNRIETLWLSEFTHQDSLTVKELRSCLLEKSPPVIILGLFRPGQTNPILNPACEETVSSRDLLYCLRKT